MLTTERIKELNTKMNGIWDIVGIINNVADQTKIIAFNAELEASSSGEAGKNFHIVATEIRRLSDTILDSIKEIKIVIDEIQKASDRLILDSNGNERHFLKKTIAKKMVPLVSGSLLLLKICSFPRAESSFMKKLFISVRGKPFLLKIEHLQNAEASF